MERPTKGVMVQHVQRMEYDCLDVDADGFVTLMDHGSLEIRSDLRLPAYSLGQMIRHAVECEANGTVTVVGTTGPDGSIQAEAIDAYTPACSVASQEAEKDSLDATRLEPLLEEHDPVATSPQQACDDAEPLT